MSSKRLKAKILRTAWEVGVLWALCAAIHLPLCAQSLSPMDQAEAFGAWEALKFSPGLDLRDQFNRPISRSRLASELRSTSRSMSRRTASSRELLYESFLQRVSQLIFAWRIPKPFSPWPWEMPGLILDPPKPCTLAAHARLVFTLCVASSAFFLFCFSPRPNPLQCLALRC